MSARLSPGSNPVHFFVKSEFVDEDGRHGKNLSAGVKVLSNTIVENWPVFPTLPGSHSERLLVKSEL